MDSHQFTRSVKIVECPRDAMQGLKEFIPTTDKIRYINSLLKVGFDTIDFGSFVSERAIPQMKDTAEVLESLDLNNVTSKLLAIVANSRGGEQASAFRQISYLGFPFSISETFQKRNTNKSISEALITVNELQEMCIKSGKELVIYISMGFGNPYGDPYSEEIVLKWVEQFADLGIPIISIADTVGVATPLQVSSVLNHLIPAFPNQEIGVHLHSSAGKQEKKILAALEAGCIRFDGALKGIGGCPMADDELLGNINTEQMIVTLQKAGVPLHLNNSALIRSLQIASETFHL